MWKDIPGYEGKYSVNKSGLVRSNRYGVMRLYTPGGKYPSVRLCISGKQKTWNVHSLVASTFIGPIGTGKCVNHKNGIKTDNRLSNLEIVTFGRNLQHSFELGLRSKKGEKHHQNKITNKTLEEIRKMLAQGITQTAIARKYKIHQSTVSDINTGRTWDW